MADQTAERKQVLDLAISQIDKQYGKGSIMRLGDNKVLQGIQVISTGSLALDAALGVGGVPRGRITEIYGPESSGKTTLALHIIAEAQKLKGIAAFIDAEHALDAAYTRNLGVDIDNLLVSQPDTGEQALEITETLVRSGALDVIVVDSVAALVPRAEIEGEMGDAQMGLQARLMSQAMRKLTGAISKSRCAVIFINQIREKLGVMFGSPETTTGGRALKFYSSVRMDIRRIASIKDKDSVVGNLTKVKVVKNKVAAPFKEVRFDIMYGVGISKAGELLDIAVDKKIVEKSGTWFSFGQERLGQGRENVKRYLLENNDIYIAIEKGVKLELGLIREEPEPEKKNKEQWGIHRKITKIEQQKRNKKRRSIYLDDVFAFGLDEELVYRFNLHEGDLLDEETLQNLILAEEKKLAKDRALRYLSYRARSVKEVLDKLHKSGFDTDTVDWVIAELKRIKFLDDRQFSLAFVRDKMIIRPMGPQLIRQELRLKGISDELIELAIEEAFIEKSQLEVASMLLNKRLPSVKNLDPIKAKKRLTNFLLRRGFSWEITREALEQLEFAP